MDFVNIGAVPNGEDCVQVGDENYTEKSRKECRAYINQLRRVYGEEPFGARLKIKSFRHDFGSYMEVVCEFHEEQKEAIDYAFNCENGVEYWDEEARKELQLIAD